MLENPIRSLYSSMNLSAEQVLLKLHLNIRREGKNISNNKQQRPCEVCDITWKSTISWRGINQDEEASGHSRRDPLEEFI